MEQFLGQLRARLRTVFGVGLAQDALPIAGLAAAVTAAAYWWRSPLAQLWVAPIAILLLAFVGVLLVTVRQKWNDHTLARIADDRLHTDDVLATWVALRDSQADDPFNRAITSRAMQVASTHSAKEVVHLRLQPVRWAALVLAMIAATGFLIVDGPAARERAQTAADKRRIEREADSVREQIKELSASTLTPETQRILTELERVAAQLDATSDPLQAAQVLEAGASTIDRTPPAERLSRRAAQRGLERSLQSQPLPDGAAEQSASQQLRQAAESVRNGSSDPAATADRLDELAASQEAGNPELAKSLSDAAQAARSGETDAAAQAADALNKAADQQEEAASKVADDEAANDTAQDMRNGAKALQQQDQQGRQGQGQQGQQGQGQQGEGQQGQQGQGQQGEGQQGQQGQGQQGQQGQGQGQQGQGQQGEGQQGKQGQGQGQQGQGQQGQGQQGQGQQGQGQGQQGQGQQGQQGQGQQGQGQGRGGQQAGRGANPSIGAPTGTIARTTDDLNVPSLVSPNSGGQTVGVGQTPSPAGTAKVPLQQAVPQSKQQANKALEKTDLEADERDLVSDYFDSLNAPPPPSGTASGTAGSTQEKP